MNVLLLYNGTSGSNNLLSIFRKNGYNILGRKFSSIKEEDAESLKIHLKTRLEGSNNNNNIIKTRMTSKFLYPWLFKEFDKIILLDRYNKFHQSCSAFLKNKTKQANAVSNSEVKTTGPFFFPKKSLINQMNKLITQINYIKTELQFFEYSHVYYEKLFLEESEKTLSKLLLKHNIYEDMTLKGKYIKMSSEERYRKLITNYDKLKEKHDTYRKI